MQHHDPLAQALEQLSSDHLSRLARSLAYRASRDTWDGQVARAAWHRTLRLLVVGELARRDGQIKQISNMSSRLRACGSRLSEREIVGLIADYQAEVVDFERHCARDSVLLMKAILAALRHGFGRQRCEPDAVEYTTEMIVHHSITGEALNP